MADPQPVPINAKFDDDFVTQLVVVLDTDTMREVAAGALNHFYTHALPCSCVSNDAGVSWPDRVFFLILRSELHAQEAAKLRGQRQPHPREP
jgi:Toluene-4-monooxygenase system protein B (TmoB)